MTASSVIGIVIVAVVMLAIVIFSGYMIGWRDALKAWTFAIIGTAIFVLGAALATGTISF